MTRIIGHWSNGGTGITNFEPDVLPLYKKAIEIYGEKTLWVEYWPMMGTPEWCDYLYSLHSSDRRDLSLFWNIFNSLKAGKIIITKTETTFYVI
jgi:hypothetical protein